MALDIDPPIDRVIQWCHRTLGTLTERGAIVRVDLTVTRAGGEGFDRLETIPIHDGKPSPEDLAQLLSDAARAEAEAAIAVGRLRFEAYAFDTDHARAEPVSRVAFTLDATPRGSRFGDAGAHRNPAAGSTDAGVTALVRGSTAALETVMGRIDQALGTLQRQNEVLSARNAELMQTAFQQQLTLMGLVSDQKDNELRAVQVTMAERRKQQGFEALLGLAPLVLAQAKAGTPAAALIAHKAKDPVRMALSHLIKSLDQSAMLKIMDSLTPEQQALLAGAIEVIGNEYEEEAKSLPPDPTREQ
jgi:hypothetical protein